MHKNILSYIIQCKYKIYILVFTLNLKLTIIVRKTVFNINDTLTASVFRYG